MSTRNKDSFLLLFLILIGNLVLCTSNEVSEMPPNNTSNRPPLPDNQSQKNESIKSEAEDMLTAHVSPHDDDEVDVNNKNETKSVNDTKKEEPASPPPKKSLNNTFTETKSEKPIMGEEKKETDKSSTAATVTKVSTTTKATNAETTKLTPTSVTPTQSTISVTQSTLSSTSSSSLQSSSPPLSSSSSVSSSIPTTTMSSSSPLPSSTATTITTETTTPKIVAPTPKKTSSGYIALMATLTFAVTVIITYFGLVLWRRYLEYRYGNRELLVNEMEFDATSDFRHFEL